jgi:Xaa-Pro aminopeptidase
MSPENFAYSAGFVVPSHPLMRWRHAAAVTTVDGRQAMVCVDMEETTVRGARPGVPLRVWAEFGGDAMVTLADQLTELGLAESDIGVEFDYAPVGAYTRLAVLLPKANLVPIDGVLADVRQIKTTEELALLERLSRISDSAISTSLRAVRAGCTEMDIAAELTRSIYEQGAQQFKLMIVATGERSELPNVGPSNRTLKAGDVCRVEIFSVIDGYHAGVCRTAVVGEPPAEAERIYAHLVECKHLVLDAIRPGVAAAEVYRRFRTKFSELGMAPIGFVGHGIGVDLHEHPYLGPDAGDVLHPGMVLGVEPLVYRTGYGFGMQIKDMLTVTADGCRLMSDVTDTDELLLIDA